MQWNSVNNGVCEVFDLTLLQIALATWFAMRWFSNAATAIGILYCRQFSPKTERKPMVSLNEQPFSKLFG